MANCERMASEMAETDSISKDFTQAVANMGANDDLLRLCNAIVGCINNGSYDNAIRFIKDIEEDASSLAAASKALRERIGKL